MNKVWIVFMCVEYEGDRIDKVFTNEKQAEEYTLMQNGQKDNAVDVFYISVCYKIEGENNV